MSRIDPVAVAAYIEQIGIDMAKPSAKQHPRAIRQIFEYLVTGGILSTTPAASLRDPSYVVKRGKTPVLPAQHARQLFDSIDSGLNVECWAISEHRNHLLTLA